MRYFVWNFLVNDVHLLISGCLTRHVTMTTQATELELLADNVAYHNSRMGNIRVEKGRIFSTTTESWFKIGSIIIYTLTIISYLYINKQK